MINLHHDGSWLSIRNAHLNDTNFNTITDQFSKVWKQIAEHFKDYGLFLMFQSFNEIHDGNWGSLNSMQNATRQLEIINLWNQRFTDVVRETGGNNAFRFLVIPGYCQKPHLYEESMFTLPEDTISGKQVVSFHYYETYPFAHDGREYYWGSDVDKLRFAQDFRIFRDRFSSKNIPVVIGETGPVKYWGPWEGTSSNAKFSTPLDTDPANLAEAHKSRLEYIAYMFGTAKEFGLVPVYWDNGLDTEFGIFNRTTGAPLDDKSRECIEAMVNAVK
jgi:endoglucanase